MESYSHYTLFLCTGFYHMNECLNLKIQEYKFTGNTTYQDQLKKFSMYITNVFIFGWAFTPRMSAQRKKPRTQICRL